MSSSYIDWLYSDPHFNHESICKKDYADRPWSNTTDMNAALMERYNAVVQPGENVLWLGDCFFGSFEQARAIFECLNGNKYLIIGNHDQSASRMARLGFILVMKELTMHIAGRTVTVSHYPYWDQGRRKDESEADRFKGRRPQQIKGRVYLHGHTHQKKPRRGNLINVGVDAWGYGPARMRDVAQLVSEI